MNPRETIVEVTVDGARYFVVPVAPEAAHNGRRGMYTYSLRLPPAYPGGALGDQVATFWTSGAHSFHGDGDEQLTRAARVAWKEAVGTGATA